MLKNVRYIQSSVQEDLQRRMVFIGGPRQVGKTTLALTFLKSGSSKNPAYLNWDHVPSRSLILNGKIPSDQALIIFDEIHKYSKWRSLIKGLYDVHHEDTQFIVTGSARLDHFRKGGDSLFGRYQYYRLHPFTLTEISKAPTKSEFESLFHLSGFPEPLFSGRLKDYKRWHLERINRVVYTDINDLENLQDIASMQLLVEALDSRVGSPLSIENLRQDLGSSHPTVSRWLDILEAVYMTYRISPFGSPKIRAVKKERKLYFWDWAQVTEKGARFENLVASHLLKFCHYKEDTQGDKMELHFLRDRDGREVDFVVLENKKPLFAVECKSGERSISSHISYFKERTTIPEFYQVHTGTADYGNAKTSGRCVPFWKFCQEKKLP
ncbi:MAG: ATP-binding protein [Pseudobdellovibrionaceae bacterium]